MSADPGTPGRDAHGHGAHGPDQHGPQAHGHGLAPVAGTTPARNRRKRLSRGLTLSVLTVVVLALGLEIGLRASGDRQRAFEAGINRTHRRWVELLAADTFEEVDDDSRRYAMRPGARCEVDGWLFRVTSHRTRGADFPAEKPPDERRLLALGDSFCFGLWADEDETLVGHLAAMANEREDAAGSGVRWRAVNLGVPGYHSGQQLLAFEQDGLVLDPDAVILYYNANDLERPGFFYDEDLYALRNDHLPLPVSWKRVLWSSHLYGFLARKHTEALAARASPYLNPSVPYSWVRPENQEDTRRAITRIAELCRERGLPLFFVNQPPITWSGDARHADWPALPIVRWASRLREELDLPGIDLLGWLRGYADGTDRFPAPPDEGFIVDRYFAEEAVQAYFRGEGFEAPEEPDFHLTGEGYRHIARLCYPRMREAGILP